jgi:phosphoribosylformylglycinamidine cyclo-ligase
VADQKRPLSYRAAGVDIDAGNALVAALKPLAKATARAGSDAGLGGFGALFDLKAAGYRDPILVVTTDGVGTKLKIAIEAGRHDTVGIDLVAMLVDDLACVGAEPLFLLDYVAVGKLEPARLEELVTGIAEGCRLAGTALLGGETAEHAGVMAPDDLDVAGFAVGVVERGDELGPERVRDGDVLVGFASPGLRSNGYSLARRVLVNKVGDLSAPAWDGAEHSLGDELLVPSVIYAPTVTALRHDLGGAVHACAHVTGGGIVGNVARILTSNLDARIEMDGFDTPKIFFEIQRRGRVHADEMVRVFNCGLGMVLALDPSAADAAVSLARANGVVASMVGSVRSGKGEVVLS